MRKYRCLDLCCCQGGASKGYTDAGFEVVGVDIEPQLRYPYSFFQADGLEYLLEHGHKYDFIHASPPCSNRSTLNNIWKRDYPDLIPDYRNALIELGLPYVIENGHSPPLRMPIQLCGAMFGLRLFRHRSFESNIPLTAPTHKRHTLKSAKVGRYTRENEFWYPIVLFSGVFECGQEIGWYWLDQYGMSQAIPPAYTEHIGKQVLAYLENAT